MIIYVLNELLVLTQSNYTTLVIKLNNMR